jgi:four helix bundle protein
VGEERRPLAEALKARTKAFALRVIRLCRALPESDEARVIRRQLLRSATSVAANHRAATRARSRREFAARIGVVVEEADESVFWIELLVDAELIEPERVADLLDEANQLVALFFASYRTARRSQVPRSPDPPILR